MINYIFHLEFVHRASMDFACQPMQYQLKIYMETLCFVLFCFFFSTYIQFVKGKMF